MDFISASLSIGSFGCKNNKLNATGQLVNMILDIYKFIWR